MPKNRAMTDAEQANLYAMKANEAFNPSGPIHKKDMFKGRLEQIGDAMAAINQTGLHAIIIGERGVGKTSLSNFIQEYIPNVFKINCGSRETFDSVWRNMFSGVRLRTASPALNFADPTPTINVQALSDQLPATPLVPSDILSILAALGPVTFIFDEFDTLPRQEAKPFSDLLKAISDYGQKTTIILVGVAESVANIVEDHGSIERCLKQIIMPRMKNEELSSIISGAETHLGMSFETKARDTIVSLSQGLPYFTHLVGLNSVKEAIGKKSWTVGPLEVKVGIENAIRSSEQSLKDQYQSAIYSANKNALYKDVILSCAISAKDEFGFFRLTDIAVPLSKIKGKKVVPGVFASHISSFTKPERGNVLIKRGTHHNFVYRFRNPLLQPFSIMQGISSGVLPQDWSVS